MRNRNQSSFRLFYCPQSAPGPSRLGREAIAGTSGPVRQLVGSMTWNRMRNMEPPRLNIHHLATSLTPPKDQSSLPHVVKGLLSSDTL